MARNYDYFMPIIKRACRELEEYTSEAVMRHLMEMPTTTGRRRTTLPTKRQVGMMLAGSPFSEVVQMVHNRDGGGGGVRLYRYTGAS